MKEHTKEKMEKFEGTEIHKMREAVNSIENYLKIKLQIEKYIYRIF
jgi:hypothetical protein